MVYAYKSRVEFEFKVDLKYDADYLGEHGELCDIKEFPAELINDIGGLFSNIDLPRKIYITKESEHIFNDGIKVNDAYFINGTVGFQPTTE